MSMTDKKMKSKQAIEGNFDLNAFVAAAAHDEDTPEEPKTALKTAVEPQAQPKAPKPAAKPVAVKSKPKKPTRENLSVRVQIRMTETEFKVLEEQAGLIPHSAFLRKFLQDNGLI